jgi:3-hydroxymyristoyl/3-hydroxydecanoyl-(acyl carrier protein) dehydratase
MTWLSRLPHQIPFRAASAARRIDEKRIEGAFLWTANDLLTPEVMLVEAMAQFAGGLAFQKQGYLTGIDRCEVTRAIEPGDLVDIAITLEAEFGGIFRFSGVATIAGVEVASGRFYLSTHAEA